MGALTPCEYFVVHSCLSAVFLCFRCGQDSREKDAGERSKYERFKQKHLAVDIKLDSHEGMLFYSYHIRASVVFITIFFFSGPDILQTIWDHVAMCSILACE